MKALFGIPVLFALASCGGGGDDAAHCTRESEILFRVNEARNTGRWCGPNFYLPAPPVAYSEPLTNSAVSHVGDMSLRGFVAHKGSDGSEPKTRAEKYGYVNPVGENVASGFVDAADLMGAFLKSPVHCENIMNYRIRNLGFACSPGAEPFRVYWALEFGT